MIAHRTAKDAGHPYTRIDNEALRDARLSLKARGLLALVLSMSEAWDLSVRGVAALQHEDGVDSVRAAWRELERAGYLLRQPRQRDGAGRLLGVRYEVFERPAGDPRTGSPHVDGPRVANPTQRTNKAEAKNDFRGTMTVMDMEGSKSTESEKNTRPAGDRRAAAVVGGRGVAEKEVMEDCRKAADESMARNIALASARYWGSLDELVAKHRRFGDVFGQDPKIAWTGEEVGYLNEIVRFCRAEWPSADPAERVGALVRGAFRRGAKAHQILRFWVEHGGCRVSLRPYLTLAGGGSDPAKRQDFLREVAAVMDVDRLTGLPVPPR